MFLVLVPVSDPQERSKMFAGSSMMGFEHEGLPACGSFLRAHGGILEMFTGHSVCKGCGKGKHTKYSKSKICCDTVTAVSHTVIN